jgi:hypothetical protein
MTPEGRTKKQIKDWFKLLGDRVYYYMPIKRALGTRTIDFLVCMDGRYVGIEAKSATGRLTALQAKTLKQIAKAGGLAYVARPGFGKSSFVLHLLDRDGKIAQHYFSPVSPGLSIERSPAWFTIKSIT